MLDNCGLYYINVRFGKDNFISDQIANENDTN